MLLLDMKLKGKVPLLHLKIKRNFTNMSICDFGIKNNRVEGALVNILVQDTHPLIKLANVLPWEKMFEII